MKKYFNHRYADNIIHLGGQGTPVNDGIITLSDEDVSKWHGIVLDCGFLEIIESDAEKTASQAINEQPVVIDQIHQDESEMHQ